MTSWLRAALKFVPLRFYKALMPTSVTSFVFHVVSDEDLAHVKYLFPYKSPAMFEADLVYLKQNYRLVSYAEVVELQAGGTHAFRNLALVTCDDGYRECFTVMRPLLERHNVPCIFFVTTDFSDNRKMYYRSAASLCVDAFTKLDAASKDRFLTSIKTITGPDVQTNAGFASWVLQQEGSSTLTEIMERLGIDPIRYLLERSPFMTREQIQQLAAAGFTIGAHSKSHRNFSLLDEAELRDEILGSCRIIKEITGQKNVPFAFPFSSQGVSLKFMEQLLADAPAVGHFFDVGGLDSPAHFLLNRLWVDPPPLANRGSTIPSVAKDAYIRKLACRLRWRKKAF